MFKRTLVPAAFVLLLVACSNETSGEAPSENMTRQDVVARLTPAVCEKARECYSEEAFSADFPGGVDDCTAKVTAYLDEDRDLDVPAKCTSEELDACTDTLKKSSCPAENKLPTIPCKC